MKAPAHILFDFDGTLIDSAEGILASLKQALKIAGVTAAVPLERQLIGPPLRTTLARLSGSEDVALLDQLTLNFLQDYDQFGYQRTQPYLGIPEMLQSLRSAGISLRIVTNKRFTITHKFLNYLGWLPWFTGVHSLDETTPPAINKSTLVQRVLTERQINTKHTWMVGDSIEDRTSAKENSLRFFAAQWGYGSAADNTVTILTTPMQLVETVNLAITAGL